MFVTLDPWNRGDVRACNSWEKLAIARRCRVAWLRLLAVEPSNLPLSFQMDGVFFGSKACGGYWEAQTGFTRHLAYQRFLPWKSSVFFENKFRRFSFWVKTYLKLFLVLGQRWKKDRKISYIIILFFLLGIAGLDVSLDFCSPHKFGRFFSPSNPRVLVFFQYPNPTTPFPEPRNVQRITWYPMKAPRGTTTTSAKQKIPQSESQITVQEAKLGLLQSIYRQMDPRKTGFISFLVAGRVRIKG